ncbi:MAG: hypothetical protein ACRD1Z_20345, partial [Vicinamibacteria bacterium]
MKQKTLWTSLALALAVAGAFGKNAGAAQKKEDIILSELRQIQAQLAELQSSQAALKSAFEALSAE